MLRPSKLLRHIAVYSASVPTLAAPPVVAGATIYMPSQVAARVLGDCQPDTVVTAPDPVREQRDTVESKRF